MVLSCPILDSWVTHICQPVVGRLEKICPVLPPNGSSAIKVILQHHLFQFSSVQLLSHVPLFATPWTAARQASLSITNSQRLLKLISIESVISSNHLILCCPLLLPPSVFPSIKVFSDESVLHIRWPEHWSFSFSISPSNEYSRESSQIPQFKSINSSALSFL